jgi:hypothetical protein
MRRGSPPIRSAGGFKVLVTGPHGFERAIYFSQDEEPAVITAHVRAALNE